MDGRRAINYVTKGRRKPIEETKQTICFEKRKFLNEIIRYVSDHVCFVFLLFLLFFFSDIVTRKQMSEFGKIRKTDI